MMPTFTPERLTLMRERRGLPITRLARESGVGEKTIRQWESGRAIPEDDTLSKVADYLDVPIDFFFGEPLERITKEAASFRAATKLTATKRDAALAAATIAMHFASWIAERFDLPEVKVPHVSEFESRPSFDPELAAEAVRSAWGIGNQPAPNMVHLLEANGVLVFALAEDCRELDAFSYWVDGRPFVFLNTKKSGERGRYDAAHELGHLVLHRELPSITKEQEEEANRFASAFLMPRDAILATRMSHPFLQQILAHKAAWNVAATAFTRRLRDVGLISDWHYHNLMIQLTKLGYRNGEPDGIQRERSQLLSGVLSMMREEGMTPRQIALDLHVSERDLNEMVFFLAQAISVPAPRLPKQVTK